MKKVDSITTWIYRLTQNEKFFVGTVLLLAVQAVWLAFSAIFPLPFDEYVHLGEIQIYAHQWSPFITHQPAYASIYGDITREPSFLYYYLMSFPYRFFELFTHNQMALVIAMRLLNVVFVVGGMILFRKLLDVWGVSRRIRNVALLAFVSTPIIPFLVAHVNYDNLMFLLAPLFLLVATRLITDGNDLLRRILLFGFLGATTILVKRTFLPLAGVAALYVLVVVWRRDGLKLFKNIHTSWKQTRKGPVFIALCLGFVLAIGLFAERYGGNVVKYGSIWPECHRVQTREICAEYGPWHRDNIGALESRPTQREHNIVGFTAVWIAWMMRGYYAIFAYTANGVPRQGDPFGSIEGQGQLQLLIAVGDAALLAGIVVLVWQRKKIWHNPYLRFALVICIGFLVAQWFFNLQTYLKLWNPSAVQARYTYPLLIIMFMLLITAVSSWISSRFDTFTAKRIKSDLFLLFVIVYVWGGGIAGWIVRSPDSWHWQNSIVQATNHGARDVLRYLVIH